MEFNGVDFEVAAVGVVDLDPDVVLAQALAELHAVLLEVLAEGLGLVDIFRALDSQLDVECARAGHAEVAVADSLLERAAEVQFSQAEARIDLGSTVGVAGQLDNAGRARALEVGPDLGERVETVDPSAARASISAETTTSGAIVADSTPALLIVTTRKVAGAISEPSVPCEPMEAFRLPSMAMMPPLSGSKTPSISP